MGKWLFLIFDVCALLLCVVGFVLGMVCFSLEDPLRAVIGIVAVLTSVAFFSIGLAWMLEDLKVE